MDQLFALGNVSDRNEMPGVARHHIYPAIKPSAPLFSGRGDRGSRIDLHSSRHADYQAHAFRHLIDVDPHRHTLREAHPGEDRIYRGEPCGVRLYVWDVDATGDAADMTTNELAVAHQFDGRRVAVVDPAETGFLEVAVDPKGVGVDEGDQPLADIGVVPELGQQICHVALDRRTNDDTADSELRLGNGGLIHRDCCL